ncbi:hypothetical protein MMC08_003693 [Hypocenomyce scalaris]|nr:hypothetical protein [Hypocenomyce scalaris]
MQTVNGWTPLHYLTWYDNDSMMTCLLRYGANVDTQDLFGKSPIFLAIAYNSHKSLVALLKAEADCSILSEGNNSILHFAAAFGDETTLRTLTASKISGMDCNLQSYDWFTPAAAMTARDLFWECRTQHCQEAPSDDLAAAFEDLLAMIEEQNLKAIPTNATAGPEPQDENHANTSGDATATSTPPMPGAWNFSE